MSKICVGKIRADEIIVGDFVGGELVVRVTAKDCTVWVETNTSGRLYMDNELVDVLAMGER